MLCGSLSRSCLDHCSLTDLNTHQASRFHHIYDNSRNMVTCILSIWRHHQTHTHNSATNPSPPPRTFSGDLLSAFFVFTRAHSAINILTTTITSIENMPSLIQCASLASKTTPPIFISPRASFFLIRILVPRVVFPSIHYAFQHPSSGWI